MVAGDEGDQRAHIAGGACVPDCMYIIRWRCREYIFISFFGNCIPYLMAVSFAMLLSFKLLCLIPEVPLPLRQYFGPQSLLTLTSTLRAIPRDLIAILHSYRSFVSLCLYPAAGSHIFVQSLDSKTIGKFSQLFLCTWTVGAIGVRQIEGGSNNGACDTPAHDPQLRTHSPDSELSVSHSNPTSSISTVHRIQRARL